MRVEAQRRGTGAVAHVVAGPNEELTAYGHTSDKRDRAVDGGSIFQIASLTKIFTALLLADAAERGEVGLADPLSRHLPGRMPKFEGREPTLRDLASHTSGLPLRPLSRAGASQENPYAGYSMEDLLADAGATPLRAAPGSRFEYSNIGYGLLGAALAHRIGKTYGELLRDRILGPLALEATALSPTPAMRQRLVQGYNAQAVATPPWDFGALAPAGGLFSSVRDISRFLSPWRTGDNALKRGAIGMLKPIAPADGAHDRIGLGWRIRAHDGKTIAWSTGTGGGVRSFMAIDIATGKSVAAFINMATGSGVDDIGFHALDPASPVDRAAPVERKAISVGAAILQRYVGRYAFAPNDVIEIVRENDGLTLVQGGQRIQMFAESATRFFIREDNVTLDFADIAADGQPRNFVLTQAGQTYTYHRAK